MFDRRYASHPKSRFNNSAESPALSLQSAHAAHRQLTVDLEVVISRHFIEKYYEYLLLPDCHPAFHDGWIKDIQELMVDDEGLRYAVLANAASHIHNVDTNPGMQSLALKYYSKSIRGLSHVLDQANDPYLASCNGLLMSIILLYLHGCLGKGTYTDIPPHLQAAVRVLSLRFFDDSDNELQPFDLLAFESVLYQIFLTSTVHWSDPAPLSDFDLQFWIQAETLLERKPMFSGPRSLNSPVLGVPIALFRLVVQAKEAYQHPRQYDEATLEQLRREVEAWEGVVLSNGRIDASAEHQSQNIQHIYYEGASYLYILIISLLLEQIDQSLWSPAHNQLPNTVPRDTWQMRKALFILQQFERDDGWTNCFIGNWPTYTLGFFCRDEEDIAVIRNEMKRRWDLTKFVQIARFHEDLEKAWEHRSHCTAGTAVSVISDF
ncbi:hypothetical protein BKA63DRAFT_578403 [Paraphoma chrysanthemicola]|nr:hypothetical protein BKA63DRAFT_578403 [Paraphoma chrysanthemicola]